MFDLINLPGHEFNHVGIVVHDIEAAREFWASRFGIDPAPIFTSPPYAEARTVYCGEPTEARVRQVVMLGGGGFGVELLEPLGEPSAWADFLNAGGVGVHHAAWWVDDFEAALELHRSNGETLIQTGDFEGGRNGKDGQYAYFRRGGLLELSFELLGDR
jgi:catechol 2,3-dioxygenase-like lactoylglutathione lyase family enzyme